MKIEEKEHSLFPEEKNIPRESLPGKFVDQHEYLVHGEMCHWDGQCRDVFSPVCIHNQSGISPRMIGRYPLLTEKESLKALDAAVEAYKNGGGLWPTRSVADRIRHLEDFTYKMAEQKKEIVTLLMWEIGKPYRDSVKEFDRTIDYINNTIDSIKNLDRSSSRFVIEQGIIGQIRRA